MKISIPFGTINRASKIQGKKPKLEFQFHLVRLTEEAGASSVY